MRTLTSEALRAMFAAETGYYPILLLTISHPAMATPLYVSSDATQRLSVTDTDIVYGTVSRGTNFIYLPLTLALPLDSDEEAPRTSISLDNIDRSLVPIIRSLTSPPVITIELVMSCSVNVVEASFPDFDMTSIHYDALVITGTLSLDMLVTEPFPAGTFTPSQFPGIF